VKRTANSAQSESYRASESPTKASNGGRPSHRRPSAVDCDRRGFLRAAGGFAVAGLLAGCVGGGSAGSGGGDGATGVEEWLSDAGNFDGVADRTGSNAVTVEVGPEGNEVVFAPAAVRVRPGTTVTWRWIGRGAHNVVSEDGSIDSGAPQSGGTFAHAFDAPGTTLYYCAPHRSAGMKGAVVVEDGEPEGTGTDTA
jgi:halocyanin-like protein